VNYGDQHAPEVNTHQTVEGVVDCGSGVAYLRRNREVDATLSFGCAFGK